MNSHADTAPRLSVIIPTCHRNDLLSICLEHLEPGRQTLEPSDYEVIVTDDGSCSSAEGMIRNRFGWAKWVPGPRRGPAANRNHGARRARGGWLAFTDDDCVPDSSWLSAFEAFSRRMPEVRVMEGRTYVDRPQAHYLEAAPINLSGGKLWSCNFAIRTGLFLGMNGFDEDFPFAAMEDMDLQFRLASRSEVISFVPEAAVMHPWRCRADWERHARQHLYSRLVFGEKHPEFLENYPWFRVLLRQVLATTRQLVPAALKWGRNGMRHELSVLRSALFEAYVIWRRPSAKSFKARCFQVREADADRAIPARPRT